MLARKVEERKRRLPCWSRGRSVRRRRARAGADDGARRGERRAFTRRRLLDRFPFFLRGRAPVRPASIPAILFLPGGGCHLGFDLDPPALFFVVVVFFNCSLARVLPLVRASPLTRVGRRRRG